MSFRFLISFFVIQVGLTTASSSSSVAEDLKADARALIARVRPSVTTIKVIGRDGDQIGVGTGFIIDSKGLIATNSHVILEGREFSVELPPSKTEPNESGRQLRVLAVEASDRATDLAIIRVDPGDIPLQALPLADTDTPKQGTRVFAFGNPLGLENSVVDGIVSGVRPVAGVELIQLAIPVEPGNSGGPLVNSDGKVVGIVNMKSSIDENLGFAIPISNVTPLLENPNPVTINRWIRLGKISEKDWAPVFGATWQQRGGLITARGLGVGFGGRSLCLNTNPMPKPPFEIAVQVRMDDESGAAGIAFHSDGKDRHYGFYPSAGRMRLTCFKGSSVYTWQVLEELETEHYRLNEWNHLRVRIEQDRLKCFVNGHLVIESNDVQLTKGSYGLVKFRDTKPDFKGFKVGSDLSLPSVSAKTNAALNELFGEATKPFLIDPDQIHALGQSAHAVALQLESRARSLEHRAAQLRTIAADVSLIPILKQLGELAIDEAQEDRLLEGTLLIAKLDDPDVDVPAYLQHVREMAEEIRQTIDESASENDKREALHRYLFLENGFHGGRAEYYHVANSHLNRVIDDREGLPITLSILYMELGRRLGLEIQGVGLPGHFVVKHVTKDGVQLIDVFERGELLSTSDAKSIVASYAQRTMSEEDLRSQSMIEILSRVLNNLMGVASRERDTEAINRYCEALVALDPKSTESRILRSQIRAMTGRLSGAISDIDWLLQHAPANFDRQRSRELRKAISEKVVRSID